MDVNHARNVRGALTQLALVGSSSLLLSEARNALGGSDGVIHIRVSDGDGRVRTTTNIGA